MNCRPFDFEHLPLVGEVFFDVAQAYADDDNPANRDLRVSSIYRDEDTRTIVASFHPAAKPLAPFHVLDDLTRIDSFASGNEDVTRSNVRVVSNLAAIAALGIHNSTVENEFPEPVVEAIRKRSQSDLRQIHSLADLAVMKINGADERDDRVSSLLHRAKIILRGL